MYPLTANRSVNLPSSRPEGRRATERLLAYWNDLAVDGGIPSIGDITIPPKNLDWTNRFILKEDTDASQSVFILCGRSAAARFKAHLVGRTVADISPRRLQEEISCDCLLVSHDRKPVTNEGAFMRDDGKRILFRLILLPLNARKHDFGYILGAFSSNEQLSRTALQAAVISSPTNNETLKPPAKLNADKHYS